MKKGRKTALAVMSLGLFVFFPSSASLGQTTCTGCHPAMAAKPFYLPESPPADLLLALETPCFQYGRVLEEWYYAEGLFVTTERHLKDLDKARYYVKPLYRQLTTSRDYLRELKKEPVTSLADFQQKTGKLYLDVGKIYRDARSKTIEQMNRNIFGFIVLGTVLVLFLIVTGWRVASGSGEVHPVQTKVGYDELLRQETEKKEVEG